MIKNSIPETAHVYFDKTQINVITLYFIPQVIPSKVDYVDKA